MRLATLLRSALSALLLLSGCAAPGGKTVEVGWIAASDSFDLSARLGSLQPKDYIVWMWDNRAAIPLETVTVELVIYGGLNGPRLWSDTHTGTIRRVAIPEELALRGVLMCAEVRGRTIAHAEQVVEKGKKVFTSCTQRLPDSVRSGRAHGGFGIPLVIERKGP